MNDLDIIASATHVLVFHCEGGTESILASGTDEELWEMKDGLGCKVSEVIPIDQVRVLSVWNKDAFRCEFERLPG